MPVRGFHCVAVLAVLLVAACTSRPAPEAPPGERDIQAQQEAGYRDHIANFRRLTSVAGRIGWAGAPFCGGKVANRLGLQFLGRVGNANDAAMVEKVLGASEQTTVLAIEGGSPAAAAGIAPGDVVIAIGGVNVQGNLQKIADIERAGGPAAIEVSRNGKRISLKAQIAGRCDFPVRLITNDSVNAMGDGDKIVVTTGLMRFARNDAELALVIAHEMAHNALGHRSKHSQAVGAVMDALMTGEAYAMPAYSEELEGDADYLGLYMVARAGMPVTEAPRFWRGMGVPEPTAHGTIHPVTEVRLADLDADLGEIRTKQAARQPLLPDEKTVPRAGSP
jgi:membrane-associated protease RseP (regulator of RpoE activity)